MAGVRTGRRHGLRRGRGRGETLLRSLDLAANNWETLPTGHDEGASPAQGRRERHCRSRGWHHLPCPPAGPWRQRTAIPSLNASKTARRSACSSTRSSTRGSDRLLFCALPSGGPDRPQRHGKPSASRRTGETLNRYAVPNGTSVAAYGGEAAICSPANGLITVLDVESGQTLRTLPLPSAASDGVVGYDGNGALYYVCAGRPLSGQRRQHPHGADRRRAADDRGQTQCPTPRPAVRRAERTRSSPTSRMGAPVSHRLFLR